MNTCYRAILLEEGTNKPIKEATIRTTISSDNIQPVKSDSNGAFQIDIPNNDLSNGGIQITIEAQGYDTRILRVSPQRQNEKIYLIPRISFPPPEENPPIVSIPRIGYDNDGKRIKLVFHSLIGSSGGTMTWQFGSKTTLDNFAGTSQKVRDFLQEKFKEPLVKKSVRGSYQLFVLGVASCEGDARQEEERARERGKLLEEQSEAIFGVKTQILLLGKYKNCPDGRVSEQQTRNQRSIVIISVRDRDPGMTDDSFKEAIANAFESAYRDEAFKADLKAYLSNSNASSPLGTVDIGKYTCFETGKDPKCPNNS
jgi:hypothetical protein